MMSNKRVDFNMYKRDILGYQEYPAIHPRLAIKQYSQIAKAPNFSLLRSGENAILYSLDMRAIIRVKVMYLYINTRN